MKMKMVLQFNWSQLLVLLMIYFCLVGTYYFSTHLHTIYCTPWNVVGFLQSPFLTETVQCRALKWLFNYSHEYIRSIWLLLSTYCIKCVMDFFSVFKKNPPTASSTPLRTPLTRNPML